ncbi:MAG: hypothetical protein A2Y62_20590 [Candidatus Fischerbacteria bacterium RBG_13_37_8]|uniref:MurNAc-LAA domain-containing protein n=1 Tax=Candidatus Fischerbacteria bacterium RBG_13_37_8 TaxID=1817863 RepID=A0A1F5VEF9_9BACT|nr:MAG: hypothetical protein A2Y62_20590 [Candidatus Fischerbacteria bacterium RBG_13_37_8]
MRKIALMIIAGCLCITGWTASGLHASIKHALGMYKNAEKKEAILFSQSKKITENKFVEIANLYKDIHTAYPSAKIADDALHKEAGIYEKGYRIFLEDDYLQRSINLHKELISRYPKSIYADDAVYMVALLEWEKRNGIQAINYLNQLKTLYPKSDMSKKAEILRKTIEDTGIIQKNAKKEFPMLKSIRHWTGKRYTRVVLDFDSKAGYSYGTLKEPDRVFIDIEPALVSHDLIEHKIEVEKGFLKGVRVGQYSEKTGRVVLDFDKIKRFDIFSLSDPYRIVVDIYADEIEEKQEAKETEKKIASVPEIEAPMEPEHQVKSPGVNSDGTYSLARQLGLGVRKIVLDPGHGGKDPGAIGQNGVKEKDVALSVAKYLAENLEKEGFNVYMTREKDVYLSLEERTAKANSLEADLFISIHANAHRNKRLMGIETYYLNFAVTEEEMAIAARENATSQKNIGEMQKLIKKIMLNAKVKESKDFASVVHRYLVKTIKQKYGTGDLGVKKAPFYVLIGAQMPAILLEVSFLSNTTEANRLASATYKLLLAEGIKEGVKRYGKELMGEESPMGSVP